MQIMEHSDIIEDFKIEYGSVKVFERQFYAHLTERKIDVVKLEIKIQIRYDRSSLIIKKYV